MGITFCLLGLGVTPSERAQSKSAWMKNVKGEPCSNVMSLLKELKTPTEQPVKAENSIQ